MPMTSATRFSASAACAEKQNRLVRKMRSAVRTEISSIAARPKLAQHRGSRNMPPLTDTAHVHSLPTHPKELSAPVKAILSSRGPLHRSCCHLVARRRRGLCSKSAAVRGTAAVAYAFEKACGDGERKSCERDHGSPPVRRLRLVHQTKRILPLVSRQEMER